MIKNLFRIVIILIAAYAVSWVSTEYDTGKPKPQTFIIKNTKVKKIITSKSNFDSSKIICDRFSLKAELKDSKLLFSIDTDLPDYTNVIVTVGRIYKQKRVNDTLGLGQLDYDLDYFYKKSNIKNWRNPVTINIDNKKWKKDLEAFRDKMHNEGIIFSISSIDSNIIISATVHTKQDNPRFGFENEHLSGSKVNKNGLNTIVAEKVIPFSINK